MHRITRMLSLRYLRIAPDLYDKLFTYKTGKRSAQNEEFAPTFIKLRCDLLRDYDFTFLPDAAKGHFFCLCLLAPQLSNELPDNADWLALQIGAKEPIDLAVLVSAGFLEVVYLDTDTGELQTREDAVASAAVTASDNKADNKCVTPSATNCDSRFSPREEKGKEVNKREENAAPPAPRRARKAASNRNPSPVLSPPSNKTGNQVERVVVFLQDEIRAGRLKLENVAHRAFQHLSDEEWNEVTKQIKHSTCD